MNDQSWPPSFTLDQERVLNLLIGDRFYSNPSAALREAILNAIDAVQRRISESPELLPQIQVTFDHNELTVAIADNGIGMSRNDVGVLFTKVGASAASAESAKTSVGEFGIGVVSYFMAADRFDLHTKDGRGDSIGLSFTKAMLGGGDAENITPLIGTQGTIVKLRLRDRSTFELLLDKFPYWCRDVTGLEARLMPDDTLLHQGDVHRSEPTVEVERPPWVERSHLRPVADPTGWDGMTGTSTVSVLYRGVFVQEFEVKGVWGIEGSIDVDPKHFKPRLNREGFVEGEFRGEVDAFLRDSHPVILNAMAVALSHAIGSGTLSKWTERRWASLWLSVPRTEPYAAATRAWDTVFRMLPAFEIAVGNKWEAVSLERLTRLPGDIYIAPLPDEKSNDVVRAALHLLRNTGRAVVRGVRKDSSWMKFAPASYRTTADLISAAFADELPSLVPLSGRAEEILNNVARAAPLYTGPPSVDLARLGSESPPVLRLKDRLVINTDHRAGVAIARDALDENGGAMALIAITARHAYEQLSEVAAAVRGTGNQAEILSPVRRRFVRGHLT